MRKFNKQKFIVITVVVLLTLLFGCGKKKAPADEQTTPSPAAEMPVPTVVIAAKAEIGQTIAYYFANIGGSPTLYGAAEVKNTGTVPLTITSASFNFSAANKNVSKTMSPIFSDRDIIAPGELAQICLWSPFDAKGASDVSATVEVTVEVAAAEGRRSVSLSNLRAIENYPGIATLSGSEQNDSEENYSYTVNYAAFYDSENKFLGAWFFTKDAALDGGAQRSFVVHMQSLPVPDLAKNTAKITGRSFGIN